MQPSEKQDKPMGRVENIQYLPEPDGRQVLSLQVIGTDGKNVSLAAAQTLLPWELLGQLAERYKYDTPEDEHSITPTQDISMMVIHPSQADARIEFIFRPENIRMPTPARFSSATEQEAFLKLPQLMAERGVISHADSSVLRNSILEHCSNQGKPVREV